MREFIFLTEQHIIAEYADVMSYPVMEDFVPVVEVPTPEHPMLEDCRTIVFKLRAFMESAGGDYALGVETGMQQAADMLDSVIKRYSEGDELE